MNETTSYDAHLSNLRSLTGQARAGREAGELAVSAAAATCLRAENLLEATLRASIRLYHHDFGTPHGENAHEISQLLIRQLDQARTARRLARESLATTEDVIALCELAARAFETDHGQLAEAHASAPHAAKTREAYQST